MDQKKETEQQDETLRDLAPKKDAKGGAARNLDRGGSSLDKGGASLERGGQSLERGGSSLDGSQNSN